MRDGDWLARAKGGGAEPDCPRVTVHSVNVRDPRHLVMHQGYSVLVTRPDGRIGLEPGEGLYDTDTRILS